METQTKGRVLLVEEPHPAGAKKSALARAGFETRSVWKEPAAIALAAKEDFDVLVIDMDLPGMDGMSLIRRMREHGSVAAVVWLAARHTNELAAKAAEAGVLQVLEKSADTKALARVVAAGVKQTRHQLSTLRAILHPSTPHRSVPATEAKNEFGSILETAVQDGAVVITKHDAPKAILVSVERMAALLATHEPDLQALTREFDDLVARMRTENARAAARGLFTSTPEELGEAAVSGVTKRRG